VTDNRTRSELLRIIEEMKSERDAAKRDTLRAFDERNVLLNRLEMLVYAMRQNALPHQQPPEEDE
jgi:hypothetical protein